jgi:hypothetical protein
MQKPTSNASVVEHAKSILESFGYKVKSGHIYEMLSRLSHHKSWNHASAANIEFQKELSLTANELDPRDEDFHEKGFVLPISDPHGLWHRFLNWWGYSSIELDEEDVAGLLKEGLPKSMWREHGAELTALFTNVWKAEVDQFFEGLQKLMPHDPDCRMTFEDLNGRVGYRNHFWVWFAYPSRTHGLYALQGHLRAEDLHHKPLRDRPTQEQPPLVRLESYISSLSDRAYDHIRAHVAVKTLIGQQPR